MRQPSELRRDLIGRETQTHARLGATMTSPGQTQGLWEELLPSAALGWGGPFLAPH